MKNQSKTTPQVFVVLSQRAVNWPARRLKLLAGGLILASALGANAAQLAYFLEAYSYEGAGHARGLYNFDPVTGLSSFLTPVAGIERFFAMDVRPSDGTIFAVSVEPTPGIFTIDVDTGTSSLVGLTGIVPLPGNKGLCSLAFNPLSSQLFGLQVLGGLYTIDQTTGAATFIGNTGNVDRGLAFSPSGQLFGFSPSGALYRIDSTTGNTAAVGGTGNPVSGVTEDAVFTSQGELFVTDYFGTIFKTDPLSGNGAVCSTGHGFGLTAIFEVPEPSSVALLIGAVGILAILRTVAPGKERPR